MKNTNRNINKQQNLQIAALQRKVAQMKMLKAMPKKARRAVAKRSNILARASHPLMPQIKGLVNPFSAVPGTVQHLVDAVPSVKYTLKGRTTVTVPATGDMQIYVAPTMAGTAVDSLLRPSAVVLTSTGGSQYGFPLLESNQAGVDWKPTGSTGNLIIPNRPYFDVSNSLDGWRLVSYGVRVRYTGTALNANGTLKVLAAPHGEFNLINAPLIQTSVTELQNSMQTAYKSVYDKAVYEFNFIGNDEWAEGNSDASKYSCAIQDRYYGEFRLGQASSPYIFSEAGAMLFYTNNSTAGVQFEVELIEHWEVKATNLQPFYTPSHTEPTLHHEIMNIVNTAHAQHGTAGAAKSFSSVVGDVCKASKSPLGKAVLAAALA